MKKKMLTKFIPFMVCTAFLVCSLPQASQSAATDQTMKAVSGVKAEANVLKGKVVGKSNKAKTISIEVGKGKDAKTMMVKFNDATTGIEHATKGHAAIIKYKVIGIDKIAVNVKPKLAKLPKGVVEVQPSYVASIISIFKTPAEGHYFLVDSRPSGRFHEGSLPSAVSIPVPKIKKEGAVAVLPKDKSTELIFFCGGPT